MKRTFTLLLVLLTMVTNAQLTNGLVAHWNFNGNVNDVSGSGMNGTPFNISYTAGKTGVANTAAVFNGTNSYISVPYNAGMNNAKFSICAMVKVNAFYTGICQANAILWRGDQFLPGYYSLIYFENPFDGSCMVQSLTKNVFAGQVSSVTGTATQWQYTPTIVTQQWYCVVTTYDGTYSRIYVDGVLKSTFTVPQPVGTNIQGLSIGANMYAKYTTHPYWMNGVMDDLRIYNRVLSQLEIDSFCDIFPSTIPEVSISQPVSPTMFCVPTKFQLHYTVTTPFNPGNTFTAQLSDATGSFATPVNIGSVTATGAGTITCTIPVNTPPGANYRVRISASNPAKLSADNGVNLSVNTSPTVNLPAIVTTCVGDALKIQAQVLPAGSNVTWTGPNGFNASGNNITIPAAAYKDSGRYIVSATYMGCTTKDTVKANITNGQIDLGKDTTICGEDSLILAPGSPGILLKWQDGSTTDTIVIKKSGTYSVTSTLGSCIDEDTINVFFQDIQLHLPSDTVLCPGTTMIITIADTFDTYKWNLPSSIDSTLKIKASGIYWVQVTKGPCSITDSIVVKDVYPYIALDANTLLCNGEQLTLKATSMPGSKYSWQNGSSADTFRVKEKGIYEVTVTNICGVFTARAVVNYRQCECNPFVPSAFTPNNDGWNDALKPRMECSPVSYHFMIANRRGQIVFESYDVNERWDGNFKGQKAGVDTYYYYLRLTDVQGIRTEHKGDILLLR